MKQSITLKLLLSSSLFRRSLLAGFFLWIFMIFPTYYVILNWVDHFESQKNFEQNIVLEEVLINVFSSAGRYGDFVNARGNVLDKGKSFGLKGLIICSGSEEILPNSYKSLCPLKGSPVSLELSGEKIQLGFIWDDAQRRDFTSVNVSFIISSLVSALLIFISVLIVYLFNFKVLSKFSENLSLISESEENIQLPSVPEVSQVLHAIVNLKSKIEIVNNENIKMKTSAVLSDLASQVSHDIRSPLSALNMMMGGLEQLPEEKRTLIRNAVQRINDIANNLLEQSRTKTQELASIKSGSSSENHEIASSKRSLEITTQLLAPIIDTIISEKRIQYRDRINVHIEADLTQSYGLFIKSNAIELKRVISNLVNNSVEAFAEAEGQVSVYIRRYGENVHVIIQDNGKGIPSEILSKLGEKGFTHGKEGTQSGTGLGIYHAKETIQSFGGEFKIESKEGMGTTIYLIFPRTESPSWFVNELQITKNSKIIVLDDDQAIHNLWDGRLQSIRSHEQGIEVLHFSALDSVNDEFIKDAELLLVDYEFLGSKKTGLDFILENQLEGKSVLVTSRYEEKNVLERCQKHGVRMIPKNMAAFIPIQIQEPKKKIDAVLLDDDSIIHMTWKMEAESKKKNVMMFSKFEDLKLALKDITKEAPIYVDVNLGQGQPRGEVIAEELYKQGYKNIYLATGYESDQFNHLTWLKGVVGKEPRF